MNDYNQLTGKSGEDSACKLLESNDFNILSRNFRFKAFGEIDIIAQKDDLIIFCEVKKRNSEQFGGPLFSISNKKKQTLKKTAQFFLTQNAAYNHKKFTYRFDLFAIHKDKEIEWIEDIIR